MKSMKMNELLKKAEKKIVYEKANIILEVDEKGYKHVSYTTKLGDTFVAIFSSTKKEQYCMSFVEMMDLIDINYELYEEQSRIYLSPNIFWHIYKKMENGKSLLTHVGTLTKSYKVNGKHYYFPTADSYFHPIESKLQEDNKRGVYGIYFREDLIYIGSSSQGVLERWKEHAVNFRDHCPSNSMYKIEDFEEIEFRLLYSDKDINEMLPYKKSYVGSATLQFVEQLLIKAYQPRYNREGITSPFVYRLSGNKEEIEVDHVEVAKDFLLNTSIEEKDKIDRWFYEKYGENAYKSFVGDL